MTRTLKEARDIDRERARHTQARAREALARVRAAALEAADEDLARQAEAALSVDWPRLGASLEGRVAVHLLAAAAEQGAPEASYLSSGDAGRALGVSINTLKKWVRLGLIRDAYRTEGGHLRVAAADVARVAQLNRDLAETPDLAPMDLGRPPAPWNR